MKTIISLKVLTITKKHAESNHNLGVLFGQYSMNQLADWSVRRILLTFQIPKHVDSTLWKQDYKTNFSHKTLHLLAPFSNKVLGVVSEYIQYISHSLSHHI